MSTIRPAYILYIALPLLLSNSALASVPCLPVEVEPHSAYRYLDALAMALGYTKQAIHEADSVAAGKTEDFSQQDATEMMVALRLGRSDLECAMALIDPYQPPAEAGTRTHHVRKTSADTSWDAQRVGMIGTSARGVYAALTVLGRVQNQAITNLERGLDSPEATKPGAMARQTADLVDQQHKAAMILFNSAISATYCAVEPDPVTGKMSRLVLTAKERDDILNTLRTMFGEMALKDDSDPKPEVPTATAAMLYRFLSEPGRTVRSE